MEWKKFSEELPPFGKKIITTKPGCNSLSITTLMYSFVSEEDRGRGFSHGLTEEMVRFSSGHWLEIPEIKKE